MNKSGLQPIEYKVLIKLDEVEEKTTGGLFIPETARDREQMMQVKAVLIATGGDAFGDMAEPTPRIGDRIYVAKAAGYHVTGADGETYRLINDKDIAAIVEEG